MLISSDVSAKRQSSFQQRAEAPIPGPTSDIAKGQLLPQRPIPEPGGVFSRRPASLEAQHHPHLSFGGIPLSSGFFGSSEDSAASAAHPLPFPKRMPQAMPGVAGGIFAPAKIVTATTGPDPDSRAGERPAGRLGIPRDLPPTDSRKRKMWDLFHRIKKRSQSEFSRLKAQDPKHPWLKLLNSSSFACRCGAGYRFDDDGSKSVSIGYANGEISWLGTYKCGSPRFCPICGAAIALKNQEEIEKGLRKAISKGFSCLLLTYTIPHIKTQSALELVEKFTHAREIAGKGGDISRFKKTIGYVGNIVRQEETYGENGWHPHIHEIFIVDHFMSDGEIDKINAKMKQKWTDACNKVGLIPENRTKSFEEHGFDSQKLHTPKQIADYIAKIGWRDTSAEFKDKAKTAVLQESGSRISGMAFEVAAHNAKAPRGSEGRTPWEILEGFADGHPGDIKLWMEYLEAFFGKALVRWSPQLKALLGIRDEDDEDKVNADEEDSLVHIYKIDELQYTRGVVKNGLWLPILDAVDQKDFETLQYISDTFEIDFRRPAKACGDYPEIFCSGSIERQKEEDAYQKRSNAAKRHREEMARAKALQEEKERARIKADREYRVSLLKMTK